MQEVCGLINAAEHEFCIGVAEEDGVAGVVPPGRAAAPEKFGAGVFAEAGAQGDAAAREQRELRE